MRKLDISMRRENSHNILLVKREADMGDNYREKMILKNTIEGLAKIKLHHLNNEAFYNIDVQNCVSLKDYFNGRKMGYVEVKALLSGLADAHRHLEEFLLSAEDLIVAPEYIFWNGEKCIPLFLYLPKCGDRNAGEELAQFLIDVTDQRDMQAVKLSSDYFNMVCDGRFDIEELLRGEIFIKTEEAESIRPEPDRSFENDDLIRVVKRDRRAERETKAKEKKQKTLRIGICICIGFTLIAAGLYAYILTDPSVLTLVYMSEDDYVLAGAIIAIVFAIAIMGTVHFYKKTAADIDEETDIFASLEDEEDYESDYLKDVMGNFEEKTKPEPIPTPIRDECDEEETVLLTDIAANSEKGIVLKGKVNGQMLEFKIGSEPFTVGKLQDKVQGYINDGRISRLHACIRKTGDRYFLSDLNSTNGTCINSRKLEANENAEIHDGDIVKFANITMRVVG